MQIELFGCTGAGKSSLLRQILDAHPGQQPAITRGDEFFLRRVRLAWVKGAARAVVLNVLCIAMSVFAWRKRRAFLHHVAARVLQLRKHIAPLEVLRIVRITLRNVGLYEFIERYVAPEEVVFTDEGMLQIAHYLYVHIAVAPCVEQLEAFAKLAPLPAVVVYIRQPDALLIDRTAQRGHKRIPAGSSELVKRFVTRATATFEFLIQQPAIRGKLLVIEGEQRVLTTTAATRNQQLDYVSNLIQPALSVG